MSAPAGEHHPVGSALNRAHREPRLNLKPQDDVMFVRRQQCGGCGGGVWGFYILTPDDLTLLHKGALPVVSCQVKDESGCGVRMPRLAPDCLVQIMANGGTA